MKLILEFASVVFFCFCFLAVLPAWFESCFERIRRTPFRVVSVKRFLHFSNASLIGTHLCSHTHTRTHLLYVCVAVCMPVFSGRPHTRKISVKRLLPAAHTKLKAQLSPTEKRFPSRQPTTVCVCVTFQFTPLLRGNTGAMMRTRNEILSEPKPRE